MRGLVLGTEQVSRVHARDYYGGVSGPASLACFGVFELDLQTFELRKQGRLVRLGHQPARVLALLVRRAGDLVTREDLQREIWGTETFVDFETGLSACINHVRTALGDRAASPRFIETLPRRGYRFLSEVRFAFDAPETKAERPQEILLPAASPGPIAPPSSGARRWWRRGIAIGAGVAVIVGTVAAWHWRRAAATAPLTIAVLPVEPALGVADLDETARVVTEGIIGTLATLSGERAHVLSRLHTANVRSSPAPIDAVRALGATYLVDVTLRPVGDLIRIHTKLLHTSGWVMWTVDRDLKAADLAWLSTRIADGIAADVARELTGPASAAARAPQPAAISALSTARSRRAQGRLQDAMTSFDAATRLSPDHATSWTGLGETAVWAMLDGEIDRATGIARAAEAAARALKIEPAFPPAVALEGMIALVRDGDAATAEVRERDAIAGDPRAPDPHLWLALALLAQGRDAAAMDAARDAEDLAPLNGEVILRHAQIALAARRPDVAADAARRRLAVWPSVAIAELFRALALDELGDTSGALRSLRSFAAMSGAAVGPRDDAGTLWRAIAAAEARAARPRPWLARLAEAKQVGAADLRRLLNLRAQ